MPDIEPLWTSAEIEAATGGRLSGPAFAATGITYNSREIAPGDLFVALKGARDGHDFADMAFANGATGAIVEHAVNGPAVITADTLKALEALGVFSRARSPHVKRGAVTGSVGKTSVTQAIKAGLDLAGPAHASIKSYNNHIGVPLTLARMPRGVERAVFEIGMNAPGEIAPLSRFVQPHAACVTTVGPVHIEAFADGEAGVAAEKASIFDGLVPGGVAVANGDVAFSGVLGDRAKAVGARLVTFGTGAGHDARLLDFKPFEGGARVRAELYGKALDYTLAQSGFHWGLNSLCVLLMLDALDVTLETGLEALAHFRPLAGRGETTVVQAPGGAFTLIDESYNANPLSMAAGFRSLGVKPVSEGGRRVVVLTDMLELGDQSRALHEGLIQPIAAAGLDLVHAAGMEMRRLHDALPPTRRGLWRETAAELAAAAGQLVGPGDIVMVKGSNGSKASLVAKALVALGASSDGDAPSGER